MGSRYLYHGSMFSTGNDPLKPGIMHSGEEVFWDGRYESNRFLYACADSVDAILLGLGSLTEKEIGTQGFKYDDEGGKDIFFIFNKEDLITEKELEKKLKDKVVYLYTILTRPEHGWIENNNPHNNIEGEFKTSKIIPRKHYSRADIEILKWLKDKGYVVNTMIK